MTLHPVLRSSRTHPALDAAHERVADLSIDWLLGDEATEQAVFAVLFPGWQAHRIASPEEPTSFGFRIFCAPDDGGCVFGSYIEGADWLGKDPWGNIPPQAHTAVDFLTGTLHGMRGADNLSAFVAYIGEVLTDADVDATALLPFQRLAFEFWLDQQPFADEHREAVRMLAALTDYRHLSRLLIEHAPTRPLP